jgi:hypothetical protein
MRDVARALQTKPAHMIDGRSDLVQSDVAVVVEEEELQTEHYRLGALGGAARGCEPGLE